MKSKIDEKPQPKKLYLAEVSEIEFRVKQALSQ